MTSCHKITNMGFILRYTLTIMTFYILYKTHTQQKINNYIFLLLPILLIILDSTDSIPIEIYTHNINKCTTHLFDYQINDKICDSISYLLLFLFFTFNFNILVPLLFFILYRVIGVILFYFTKNSPWLILFFDFAKEFLLYIFFFGKNYMYLPFFILCKIGFEYYWHTHINKNTYK